METELVPNRYLAAVRAARVAAGEPRWRIRALLDDAVTAMEAGAWVSARGQAMADDLAGRRSGLRARSDEAMETFDTAIAYAAQFPLVEPDSWFHRWDHGSGY